MSLVKQPALLLRIRSNSERGSISTKDEMCGVRAPGFDLQLHHLEIIVKGTQIP